MILPDSILARLAPDTVDPTLLTDLINQATAVFGRALNRYLGEPIQTVEKHGGGRNVVFLFDEPIAAKPMKVETRAYPMGPWEVVPSSDYEADGSTLYHKYCWPRGFASVQVTYWKGYELGDGPLELQAFVTRMVLAQLDELGFTGAGALAAETIGDHRKEFAGTASWNPTGAEGWQAIAAGWKRKRL